MLQHIRKIVPYKTKTNSKLLMIVKQKIPVFCPLKRMIGEMQTRIRRLTIITRGSSLNTNRLEQTCCMLLGRKRLRLRSLIAAHSQNFIHWRTIEAKFKVNSRRSIIISMKRRHNSRVMLIKKACSALMNQQSSPRKRDH